VSSVVFVVGARPNFVKTAPVVEALAAYPGVRRLVVHTGQHYDRALSEEILADLGFPPPDRHLGVGSGTHAEQTGRTLVAVERVLLEEEPELVVVSGDVNTTLAGALAAAKLSIPVAHIEAGLRSRDWSMPEEQNRVLTDRLAELLFTHSPEARQNLVSEGVDPGRIHEVGNTMIDSLRRLERRARELAAWEALCLEPGRFVLVTLHRPSNVDDGERLGGIVIALGELAARWPIVFPVHPRTRARLEETGLGPALVAAGVRVLDSLGYLEFLSLETAAGAVLTDSGGIQEETSALGVACFTLRTSTERPVTLTHGTNTLLGDDPAAIRRVEIRSFPPVPVAIPGWDGHAGKRAADAIAAFLGAGQELRRAASGG
jgi:UDP-N-acetylglucosamine 2-epimerase (non-hydrolysing)